MKYNTETIAIVKKNIPCASYCIDEIQIKKLFDIKTKHFIEGSNEDLLDYYNQQFSNENQNVVENVGFQKKLLKKDNN